MCGLALPVVLALHALLLVGSIAADTVAKQQADPLVGPWLAIKGILLIAFIALWPVLLVATVFLLPRLGRVVQWAAVCYLVASGVVFLWVGISFLRFMGPRAFV